MQKIGVILSAIFISQFVLAYPAKAYLDPGSGSYLIQILVATFAGAGLIFRSNFGKIKNIFFKKKTSQDESENDK